MSSEQTLYRFWAADELLYIGISVDAFKRAKQHSRAAAWWGEADKVTFQKYPNRRSVSLAESAAVKAEHPKYNITYNEASPLGSIMALDNPAEPSRFLKAEEVAAQLGITALQLYARRANGVSTPASFSLGGALRWRQTSVDDWVDWTASESQQRLTALIFDALGKGAKEVLAKSIADAVIADGYARSLADIVLESRGQHQHEMHQEDVVDEPVIGIKMFTVEEVSERIGISVQTIYRWRSEGASVPEAFKVGNKLRWREQVVEDWIDAQEGLVAA